MINLIDCLITILQAFVITQGFCHFFPRWGFIGKIIQRSSRTEQIKEVPEDTILIFLYHTVYKEPIYNTLRFISWWLN